MTSAFQASLFDADPVGADEAGRFARLDRSARIQLSRGAWLDVVPGWLPGADALFERLASAVPWRAERRWMYDQVVAVPRLLCHYGTGDPLPDPALAEARRALDEHYRPELGETLCTAGLCMYRDGRDSVAWHGDTSGRRVKETIVAIVSLGTPRALMLRPRGGGQGRRLTRGSRYPDGSHTLRYMIGHGDLLVMGGTCQRTWEHSVPKTAKPTGPRISVQFRPEGIR
ncbi:MAG: alpha-ketoglutarate-dependent dioxygenase AlkB [Streptosporangiaceae bacterium]